MKIVMFEVEEHERGAFRPLESAHEVVYVQEPLSSRDAARHADAEAVSVFVNSRLDKETLDRLPALQLVVTRSTGFDHIDTVHCAERGIAVANVPSYGDSTVAEHVFALLLSISHRMPQALERARQGPFSPEGLTGFDLAGKTLGVIGTGRIGRHVAGIANGFGMNVLAHDARPERHLETELRFSYRELDDLLAASDVITLHVPSLAATRNMISSRAIAKMKDGVVIINTARGDLIETRALIEGLRSGKVAAAGLDVLPDEPLIREEAELLCSIYCNRHDLRELVADHVLLRMPNVVVTPHSAFNTREALGRISGTTVDNILRFAAGEPANLVE